MAEMLRHSGGQGRHLALRVLGRKQLVSTKSSLTLDFGHKVFTYFTVGDKKGIVSMEDEYDLEEHDHDLVDFEVSDYELSDLEEEEDSFSRKKTDGDEVGGRSSATDIKNETVLKPPACKDPKKSSGTGPDSRELEEGELDGPPNDERGGLLTERPAASQPLLPYKVVVCGSFFSIYCHGFVKDGDPRLVVIEPG